MEIDNIMNQFVGKVCWGVLSGPPSASHIHLYLGEKIKNEKFLPKKLPYELDKYDGEYHLGVFCEWRLQSNGHVITGASEPNNLDGPLVTGLKRIINKKITKVELTDDCGDLTVFFDDIYLKIFCNYTGNEDSEYFEQDETNWFLSFRGAIVIEVQQGCNIVVFKESIGGC